MIVQGFIVIVHVDEILEEIGVADCIWYIKLSDFLFPDIYSPVEVLLEIFSFACTNEHVCLFLKNGGHECHAVRFLYLNLGYLFDNG